MTANTIAKLNAVSADKPALTLRYMPTRLDANAIVGVLRSLNLMVPTKLEAAAAEATAAKVESLRASGHRYTVKEIDGALSAQNVSISDRFRFKATLDKNGILER